MHLYFQGLYPREISMIIIGIIIAVSFPIVEAEIVTSNSTTADPGTNSTNNVVDSDIRIASITTDKAVYYLDQPYLDVNVSGTVPSNLKICNYSECGDERIMFTQYKPDGSIANRWMITPSSETTDGNFSLLFDYHSTEELDFGIWKLEIATGSIYNLELLASATYSILPPLSDSTITDPPVTNSTIQDQPPTISISSPINGSSFVEGTTVYINVQEPETTNEPVTNSTTTVLEDSYEMIKICHIPPDNPDNPQTIEISENAWPDHEIHEDTLGECNYDIVEINSSNSTSTNSDFFASAILDESDKTKKEHKKQIIIEKIKKQKENTKKKSELNSYRNDFNEIKNEIKLFKEQGENTDILSIKLQSIISDFQKVLKILNLDFEYDKEYKNELRVELKEKSNALKEKMTKSEQAFNNKVSSKLSELSQSNHPEKTAKELGLEYKNGKTIITISMSRIDEYVLDRLDEIGSVDAVAKNHVQLTVDLNNLKDLGSVPGIESIKPSFSAVQS